MTDATAHPLPADVISLVVAAREVFDTTPVGTPEMAALDRALERFAGRVCYDDEGGAIPEAHASPCTCGASKSDD